MESDVTANVNSDHAPLIAKIRIQLKRAREEAPTRSKLVYVRPTEEQRTRFDEQVSETWNKWREATTEGTRAPTTEELAKEINDIAENQLPHNVIKQELGRDLNGTRRAHRVTEETQGNGPTTRIQQGLRTNNKKKKAERKGQMRRDVSKNLDVRSRWMGIRQMKRTFAPRTYAKRDAQGKNIPFAEIAEETAKYLAETRWPLREEDNQDHWQTPEYPNLAQGGMGINTGEITTEEVEH